MKKIRTRTLGAAIAVGALAALPMSASATPAPAVAKVTAHTDRVDAALDRASELFAADQERAAVAAVFRSRLELRHAVAISARAVRRADTPEERADAADAVIEVGTQLDEDVPLLVDMLAEADDARADALLARLALSDAKARERAITILEQIVDEGLPEEAEATVAEAIAALSTDRSEEIATATEALTGAEEPVATELRVKLRLVIEVSFRGQERAAAILRELLEQLPAAARQGIQTALDAVTADHAQSAEARDQASAPPAAAPAPPEGTTPPPVPDPGTTPPPSPDPGMTPPPAPEAGTTPPSGTATGTTPSTGTEAGMTPAPVPPSSTETETSDEASGSYDVKPGWAHR